MKPLFFSLLLIFSCSAQAGTLYRCGNTFSQIPCGDNAQAVQVAGSDSAKNSVPAELARHVCINDLKKWVPFPDPESVKVESISRGTPEIIEYAGAKLMARRYDLKVNARNGYGGYTGAQNFSCFASEDNQRILKVNAPGG